MRQFSSWWRVGCRCRAPVRPERLQAAYPGHIWAYNFLEDALLDGTKLRILIEPGKLWQNGKEERFNGTVRDECLNMHVFTSLAEACVRLNTFRHQYNHERPHSQLGYLTPWHSRLPGWKPRQNSRISNIGT